MLGKILKWSLVAKVLDWVLDRRAQHEVQCPNCGATIRARMADREDGAGGSHRSDSPRKEGPEAGPVHP